ncbi:MAG: NYN domain-containing protein [Candidatus Schekmanbacteria bacterium]|nr:NYN domain-containing protein [Candidatus Schekmanbacteria bacterium]
MEKVGLFVDVQNIWKTFGKIKYDVLLKYVTQKNNRRLVRAAAFMSYDPNDEGQHNFMRALSHLGYRVVSKPIRRLPDGTIKGNMDLEFAIDALTLGKVLDVAILVTGDGDFVRLVEALGYLGVRVEVIGPDSNTAIQLIYAADHYTNLSTVHGVGDNSERSGTEGEPTLPEYAKGVGSV